jgi:hypothetical protein
MPPILNPGIVASQKTKTAGQLCSAVFILLILAREFLLLDNIRYADT